MPVGVGAEGEQAAGEEGGALPDGAPDASRLGDEPEVLPEAPDAPPAAEPGDES